MIMEFFRREDAVEVNASGRLIQRVFGDNSACEIDNANMGFAHFSEEKYGKMYCHFHEDEIIYVLDAKDAYVEYGELQDNMPNRKELQAGDVLRFHNGECHVFKFTTKDGYLDIIFYFSQGKIKVVEVV